MSLLSFVLCLHFYVLHLSLDKRDEKSFSDLISPWELFALEATYTMLIENRNQKESLRTAPG
jgi:hypothetical protein